MSRLNWNRGRGGGGQVSSLRGEARQASGFGLLRPQFNGKKPTTKAGKIKRILKNAKALVGYEKAMKTRRAIYGPPREKVPAHHIRLAKRDPVTDTINTVDIPIPMGTLGKIIDMLAKKKPFKPKDFGISEAHKVFIATGKWET